jgi:hypothetical protein
MSISGHLRALTEFLRTTAGGETAGAYIVENFGRNR